MDGNSNSETIFLKRLSSTNLNKDQRINILKILGYDVSYLFLIWWWFFLLFWYFEQVSTNVIHLHIDGVVVGEKRVVYASQNGVIEETLKPLQLVGADSKYNGVQGYVHYVRILSQPAIKNHYVKVHNYKYKMEDKCLKRLCSCSVDWYKYQELGTVRKITYFSKFLLIWD